MFDERLTFWGLKPWCGIAKPLSQYSCLLHLCSLIRQKREYSGLGSPSLFQLGRAIDSISSSRLVGRGDIESISLPSRNKLGLPRIVTTIQVSDARREIPKSLFQTLSSPPFDRRSIAMRTKIHIIVEITNKNEVEEKARLIVNLVRIRKSLEENLFRSLYP